MGRSWIVVLGIMSLLMGVVAISGCAENTKEYNNNLISFSYPESWNIFMDDSTSNDVQIEFEGPNIISCIIQDAELYTGNVKTDYLEGAGFNDYKWTMKTVNGYNFWDGVKESSSNMLLRQGVFQKDNKIYIIRFYGKSSSSNEYYQIVNSFKIK